jgi:hypothetical protein
VRRTDVTVLDVGLFPVELTRLLGIQEDDEPVKPRDGDSSTHLRKEHSDADSVW